MIRKVEKKATNKILRFEKKSTLFLGEVHRTHWTPQLSHYDFFTKLQRITVTRDFAMNSFKLKRNISLYKISILTWRPLVISRQNLPS